MRKRKLITIFAVVLILAFSLSACSDFFPVLFFTNEADDDYSIDTGDDYGDVTGTVTVSIVYPEESGLESANGEASIYENAHTALDALNIFCKINGIDITVETVTSSYVTSIGGVAENDFGDVSGWVYTVNGEEIWKAADECELADGDSIEWNFVNFSDTSF